MNRSACLVPLSVFALAGLLFAFEGPESGLGIGDTVPAFNPVHVTGPDKGTTKCPP